MVRNFCPPADHAPEREFAAIQFSGKTLRDVHGRHGSGPAYAWKDNGRLRWTEFRRGAPDVTAGCLTRIRLLPQVIRRVGPQASPRAPVLPSGCTGSQNPAAARECRAAAARLFTAAAGQTNHAEHTFTKRSFEVNSCIRVDEVFLSVL